MLRDAVFQTKIKHCFNFNAKCPNILVMFICLTGSLHKNLSFELRIYSVTVTTSTKVFFWNGCSVFGGFNYLRNWKIVLVIVEIRGLSNSELAFSVLFFCYGSGPKCVYNLSNTILARFHSKWVTSNWAEVTWDKALLKTFTKTLLYENCHYINYLGSCFDSFSK